MRLPCFVLQPFLGFLWCLQRYFVYSASGRKRFNVLGALNAITHEVVTITNDSYINALSVCDLLRTLAAKHAEEAVTLFLDNARYQKCKIVHELAEQLNIELIYLPFVITYMNKMTGLFHQWTPTQIVHNCLRLLQWNGIFIFGTPHPKSSTLYIKVGLVTLNAHTDGTFLAAGEITLPVRDGFFHLPPPIIVSH